MKRMARLVLLAAQLAAIASSARALRAQAPAPEPPPAAVTVRPERITVTVTGLSCPFCAYGLEKRFSKLDGLDSLRIDFKTGAVILIVRDGSRAPDARIRQLVKDGGFEATNIERSPLSPAS